MSDNFTLPRVLLVEDNPDDVFLMKRVFQKEKILVSLEVVTDGKMAVQYLEGKNTTGQGPFVVPRLVFLDLKLPYINGFQILEWIWQQPLLTSMPVVVLTSSVEDSDREKAASLRVPFLVKPPTATMVRECLRLANIATSF